MIEDASTWAVFMDEATFGESVTYTPQGGGALAITAILTNAHAERGGGDFPGLSVTAPVLALPDSFLPAPPLVGDAVTARGVAYRVADVQPDGTGLSRLILERT